MIHTGVSQGVTQSQLAYNLLELELLLRLLIECEGVHLAVQTDVRHVPVAATVELLDALGVHLGHRLVVKDEPLFGALFDPRHVVTPLRRAPLVCDNREELVPTRLVVMALGAFGVGGELGKLIFALGRLERLNDHWLAAAARASRR